MMKLHSSTQLLQLMRKVKTDMWICRTGQKSLDISMFLDNNKIYLPWEGYNADFSEYTDLAEFRSIVIQEKNIENRTTISNWSSQLYQFVNGISIDDYVLIPGPQSRHYHLAKVVGNYTYSSDDKYHHSRNIEFIVKDIPRDIFDQRTQYSLGAYRTLFKAKNEEYIIAKIKEWEKENK